MVRHKLYSSSVGSVFGRKSSGPDDDDNSDDDALETTETIVRMLMSKVVGFGHYLFRRMVKKVLYLLLLAAELKNDSQVLW